GRPRNPRLHLGNDRPPEGRHAEPSQHPLPARVLRFHHRAPRGRPAALVPPALPHRGADLHRVLSAPLGRHGELRGEHRHGAGGHPRGRAGPLRRGAAELGEVLLGSGAAHAGGGAAGQAGLPLGNRHRHARGRMPGRGKEAVGRAAPFVPGGRFPGARQHPALHGTDRARGAATGAAPIAPELIKWYLALGIDMREVYGQTENTGLATAMPADRIKLGTVGVARPDTEVAIAADGEILLKGPHVFLGYYNKPDKTAETVVDGWLHTGDVGRLDPEGFLTITDRKRDIIITAGGKNITPSEIENQLKFSPFISDAVVIGDKRKFLTCLVMIDHETVAQFAQERAVPFTNFASLCRAREVQELIEGEIERVNKQFARVETVKRFRLIEQLLTAED